VPPPFNERFIAVEARVYRKPDDVRPGVDLAWEPVPGKTPYTRDSELMNASTSAVGRAIVYALAADARSGVSSADEVRNRQGAGKSKPSEKQLDFFEGLLKKVDGLPSEAIEQVVSYAEAELTGGKDGTMSKAIEGLKDEKTRVEFADRLVRAALKIPDGDEKAEATEARNAEEAASDG